MNETADTLLAADKKVMFDMLTPEARQAAFPSLTGRVYLNTAAEGVPPISVQAALNQYFSDKQLGMDGRKPHFATLERVKELIAEFYGLTASETAVCSCSSEAYNLAAMALQLKDGDEVIINDLDFPAGVTPWLQPGSHARVRIWRSSNGALHLEDLIPLLSSKTRLVTTSLVSFFNGFVIPMDALRDTVRKHSDALLSVDVTQALGRIPLKLQDVDLIVSSTHKWILASHGGGLVGVPSKRAAELTVPAGGWFHLKDPFGVQRFDKAVSQPGAAGFAVGMPNFPAIYAIEAGLSYIRSVGVEAIHQYCQPLVQQCFAELRKLPVEMLTPENSELAGILAFRHPDAEKIHADLHRQNVHVMSHAGRIRIAVHGYNSPSDIDTLIEALRTSLKS